MTTDTVVKISEFVQSAGISMTAERWHENPNMQDSGNMDHWKCVLVRREHTGKRYNARKDGTAIVAKLTVYFSQGYGHNGREPEVTSVLDCLASEASSVENAQGFEDWASDFGYDTDSRKAEKIYHTCEHQAKRLRSFLGEDLYDQLLWHTERE